MSSRALCQSANVAHSILSTQELLREVNFAQEAVASAAIAAVISSGLAAAPPPPSVGAWLANALHFHEDEVEGSAHDNRIAPILALWAALSTAITTNESVRAAVRPEEVMWWRLRERTRLTADAECFERRLKSLESLYVTRLSRAAFGVAVSAVASAATQIQSIFRGKAARQSISREQGSR